MSTRNNLLIETVLLSTQIMDSGFSVLLFSKCSACSADSPQRRYFRVRRMQVSELEKRKYIYILLTIWYQYSNFIVSIIPLSVIFIIHSQNSLLTQGFICVSNHLCSVVAAETKNITSLYILTFHSLYMCVL